MKLLPVVVKCQNRASRVLDVKLRGSEIRSKPFCYIAFRHIRSILTNGSESRNRSNRNKASWRSSPN